jgi:hypothetical protein
VSELDVFWGLSAEECRPVETIVHALIRQGRGHHREGDQAKLFDDRVIRYSVAVEQLQELAAAHPNIMVTILANLTREFLERLRRANEAIRTLE